MSEHVDIRGRSFPLQPTVVHVYPINDPFEHDTKTLEGCLCAATIEFMDGGVVVTHNSMDGRELCE